MTTGESHSASREHWQRRLDRGVGIVTLCVGAVGALLSSRMGVWRDAGPGGGLLPLLASLVMMAAAGLVIARPLAEDVEETTAGEVRRVLTGMVLAAVFAVLFVTLGYVQSSFLVAVAWLRILAQESWATTFLIAIVAAAAIHVIFGVLLGLPLPRDWFL